ncbi:hypothetical protein [Nocardioides jensenii]|uniref:hypothetical protein n=1 Tax=Nocardioides jensenii TaxID=1843 RepID=UPI000AD55438|nr:hypothetical protein [Nocardioides jensenii]
MSNDATIDLIRALVDGIDGPSSVTDMRGPVEAWDSFAMVLEFGDGVRSAHGYAYSSDAITAVACEWPGIESAVRAHLEIHYEPGEPLPLKILVQFDRVTGKYEVTFEDSDEERWAVTPRNFREMREQLRPEFA